MTVFVWAKMQAEAGETLDHIVLRKEAERICGAGTFWWGFGASLGQDVERAAREADLHLPILFSKMLSPPKKKDSAPGAVFLWDGWFSKSGQGRIPPNVLVTGGSDLNRGHYALVCQSKRPVKLGNHGAFDPNNCWTYKSRYIKGQEKVPGPSQVVSLLFDRNSGGHLSGSYCFGFRATLVQPWVVRLTNGRQLSQAEIAAIRNFREGNDWMSLVRRLRN